MRVYEPTASGTNYTALIAPAMAANVTYTLPAADAGATGYVLSSNAAGTLSWVPGSASGGSQNSISLVAHGFSVGNVLYYTGSTYALADKDAASTAEVVGIVLTVTNADAFVLQTSGLVTTLSGLAAGTVYFLGDAGALTATEPSTVGQISKPLLIAVSATNGYFVNMRGSVVGSAASTLAVENFSGDGSDVTFTLGSSPLENNTFVMVEGVYQQKNTYSISGTTLTFTTAPPTGTNNIEVVTVGSVNIGLLAAGANFTSETTQATTSGSSINFTGIPAGTKQIVVGFMGVSTNGTANVGVLLGDSGGVEATGYVASVAGVNDASAPFGAAFTTGFYSAAGVTAARLLYGSVTLTLMDSSTNTWACQGFLSVSDTANNGHSLGGYKPLSGVLDRVQILTTDTFDAGSVNIVYK